MGQYVMFDNEADCIRYYNLSDAYKFSSITETYSSNTIIGSESFDEDKGVFVATYVNLSTVDKLCELFIKDKYGDNIRDIVYADSIEVA